VSRNTSYQCCNDRFFNYRTMSMSAGGKVRTDHSCFYHADNLRSGGKARFCSGRLLSRTRRY
jgi:hypothetical protein